MNPLAIEVSEEIFVGVGSSSTVAEREGHIPAERDGDIEGRGDVRMKLLSVSGCRCL